MIEVMSVSDTPYEQVLAVLNPYFVAAASEVKGTKNVSIDYNTYIKCYEAGALSPYYICDTARDYLIGYILVIPNHAICTNEEVLDTVSFYVIPEYRGAPMRKILRAIKKAVLCDYPTSKLLRLGLPCDIRKFGRPCTLICEMPLKE